MGEAKVDKAAGGNGAAAAAPAKKSGIMNKIFDTIGGIFKPVLVVIIGAGLLQALRDVLLMTGAIGKVSSSYIFLNALGDAVFYFLPIFLAISSANVFGATPFLAAAVAAFLVYPGVSDLFGWANSVGWDLTLFGVIPVTYARYPSSVLPIILIVWFQSVIEPIIKKIIPDLLKSLLVPVFVLFLTGMLGLVVLGPIGTWIGDGLAAAITWLNNTVPWLVPTIVGAASPFLVLTGSHYSLFPIATQNLAQLGYDTVLIPGMMASNMALAGASFAIAIRGRNKRYRSYSASAGITSLFGISQSSLYGNAIPLKKPLYASIIGGGVAGFYAGITSIRSASFVTPGLLALVGFMTPTANLINSIITCVIAFASTLVLTIVFGFTEPDEATIAQLSGEAISEEQAAAIEEEAEIAAERAREAEIAAHAADYEAMRSGITVGATRLGHAAGLVPGEAALTNEELREQLAAAELRADRAEARLAEIIGADASGANVDDGEAG